MTIDPKYIELMNLELDGVASQAQGQELRQYLSKDPVAAAHFDELGRLARRLDGEPLCEPPAELHPRIVSALDAAARRPAVRGRAGHGGWIERVFAPRRRTATVFGLGLVTGALLLAAIQFGRPAWWSTPVGVDPSHLTGTMSSPRVEQAASIDLDPAVDGAGGSAQIFVEQGVTVIETRIESPDPLDWSLQFDPGLSVSRIDAPSGGAVVLGASPGEVTARHAGAGTFRIVLSGRVDPVESVVLKVIKDGRVVAERPASPRSR